MQGIPGLPGQTPAGLPGSLGGIMLAARRRQNRRGGAFGGGQAQQPSVAGLPPGIGADAGMAPQAADVIQRLLTTPRPGGLAGLRAAQGGMQQGQPTQTFQEGIAGVASKSQSKGVKVYKGEKQFHLWEFVYDYRKDAAMSGLMAGMGGAGAGNLDPTQPGLAPGGMLGGQPGGFPPGMGGPGMGGVGGQAVGGLQPGAQQPSNEASPYQPQPPQPWEQPAPVGAQSGERPQRGSGGAGGPGTVPMLPSQNLTGPDQQNLPADVQQILRQQMEQMEQLQQQQQQQQQQPPAGGSRLRQLPRSRIGQPDPGVQPNQP